MSRVGSINMSGTLTVADFFSSPREISTWRKNAERSAKKLRTQEANVNRHRISF